MPTPARRDEIIQIRASSEAKALLNRAAAARGQNLSEFMLESARRRAEETLLDQRLFILGSADFTSLLALLDNPPAPSRDARRRLARKPHWES